jgi:hypothetical protein
VSVKVEQFRNMLLRKDKAVTGEKLVAVEQNIALLKLRNSHIRLMKPFCTHLAIVHFEPFKLNRRYTRMNADKKKKNICVNLRSSAV